MTTTASASFLTKRHLLYRYRGASRAVQRLEEVRRDGGVSSIARDRMGRATRGHAPAGTPPVRTNAPRAARTQTDRVRDAEVGGVRQQLSVRGAVDDPGIFAA